MSRLHSPSEEIQQHQAVLQRGLDAWDAMSREQRIARLKEAGILDEDGHLAPQYREGLGDEEAAKPTRSVS